MVGYEFLVTRVLIMVLIFAIYAFIKSKSKLVKVGASVLSVFVAVLLFLSPVQYAPAEEGSLVTLLNFVSHWMTLIIAGVLLVMSFMKIKDFSQEMLFFAVFLLSLAGTLAGVLPLVVLMLMTAAFFVVYMAKVR